MTTAARAAPRPWLFGPATDLLLGCGAVYLPVFAALALAGDGLRGLVPIGLMFVPLTLLSVPHYGATLIRAYEKGEDRARYRFFVLWSTAAIAALLAWGARDAAAAAWLVTVYVSWSPWHYAGQNFGISMTFLRRRGVEVTPAARRLHWWSFALSFAVTFLSMHGATQRASYAPDDASASPLPFRSLGIPADVQHWGVLAAGAACAAVTVAGLALLARRAAWRDLVPSAMLLVSQSLWFSIPALTRHTGVLAGIEPFSLREQHYGFFWVASAHAVQYLWITAYFASRSGEPGRHAAFFGRSLAVGALVWVVPGLVFAPQLLGSMSYDTGLALLVAACVNLHHFVLDGAIWKLRDRRIARVLLGPVPDAAAAPPAKRRLFPWTLAGGAVCAGVLLYSGIETEFGFERPSKRGDLAAASASLARLSALGRDGSAMHLEVGNRAAETGDTALARREFDASNRLEPNVWAYVGLGRLHARSGEWPAARAALADALALEPSHAVALLYAGVVDLETNRDAEGRAKILRAHASAKDPAVAEEVSKVMGMYDISPP